jgi:hypothetical protein
MQQNKYKHPLLLKGTRLTLEYGPEVKGMPPDPGLLTQVPLARKWADIDGIEKLGNPTHVLGEGAPENVTVIIMHGGYIYVTDPFDEVLEAWESYINDASLRHKTLLSN